MTLNLRRLKTSESGFDRALDALVAFDAGLDVNVREQAARIVDEVRARGDAALLEFTQRYDRHPATSVAELVVPEQRIAAALAHIPTAQRKALEAAAARIRIYHERQKLESWSYREPDGTLLGQQVTALDRVGLYAPGGKAAYPSSVLMNALPAIVAGVKELILVVPAPGGELNELVLAAAGVAGVSRIITIGGAQAIAALAYGTATVPRVDKIVGPGNAYVAAAKRLVFGAVGIDMIAGPSEILVICDGHTDPDWIAMDLFSQAEHDEDAQAILLSQDGDFLGRVAASMERLLKDMPRADIIRASIEARGALIEVRDLDEAVVLANRIAPEHLELSVAQPEAMAARIRHAGAIFIGRHTPEALGDYCAGPNHVLPTSGSARFSSPLGVYDFQKRSSLIACSATGAAALADIAVPLAEGEGLFAHARSADYRRKPRTPAP